MTKNEILTRFKKVSGKDNIYRAKCPVHDDAGRSVTLTFEDESLASMLCDAGCPGDAIMTALFYEPEQDDEQPKKGGGPTQAEVLLNLVEGSGAGFFRTDAGDLFATIPTDRHNEIWPLEGRAFKVWLHGLYYMHLAKPVNSDALGQSIATLSARALFDSPEPVALHTRMAGKDGAFWYDLTNSAWQAVEITPHGWRVADPPILFNRYGHQAAQAVPVPGGDLTKILEYVPIKEHPLLFFCWLVSAFIPGIPHPMPVFYGEKGAAKTTTSEFLKSLIDPSTLRTITLQNDPRTLAVNLQQHWFLPFDNVSFISEDTSDTLCRAITGGGIQQRKLFTKLFHSIHRFKPSRHTYFVDIFAERPNI